MKGNQLINQNFVFNEARAVSSGNQSMHQILQIFHQLTNHLSQVCAKKQEKYKKTINKSQ